MAKGIASGMAPLAHLALYKTGSRTHLTLKNNKKCDVPWILIVGAGTHDRLIKATVRLQDRTELVGQSANQTTTLNSAILP